jgi:DNA-binding XRE family transcriptional regulator
MTAAAFRMRWVVIATSSSLRDTRKVGADGGLLSVRSGPCSWKFAICHASRDRGERLSAELNFLPHNVVRYERGHSTSMIAEHSGRLGEIEVVARRIFLQNKLAATMLPLARTARISPLARKPNFARYLRDARIKRRLSVVEVAEQVGVSTSSIYFWETDHVRPRDANLSALCKVLKLPVRATREMAAG